MGATTSPVAAAATILVMCTFAMLAFTYMWAANAAKPIRVRPRTVGRAAVPYWHSSTGRADERGIGTQRAAAPRHARPLFTQAA